MGAFDVVALLFLIAPIVVVVFTSFNATDTVAFPPTHWGLTAYRLIPSDMFTDLTTSLEIGALAIAVAVPLCVPLTLALVRGPLPGKSVLQAVFRSPLQVPAIVIGLSLYQYYVLLDHIGVSVRGSFIGLLVGHVVIIIPFVFATMVGRLAVLDDNLEDAAAGLGAGFAYTTLRVTLPLMRPAVIAGAFLGFILSLNDVAVSLFLVGPGHTTLMVALFDDLNQAYAPWMYAISSVVVAVCFALAIGADKVLGLRTALSGQ